MYEYPLKFKYPLIRQTIHNQWVAGSDIQDLMKSLNNVQWKKCGWNTIWFYSELIDNSELSICPEINVTQKLRKNTANSLFNKIFSNLLPFQFQNSRPILFDV